MLTETQRQVSVPLQHATYEALHKVGEHFEEFQRNKTSKIIVQCEHGEGKDDLVHIISKWVMVTMLGHHAIVQ